MTAGQFEHMINLDNRLGTRGRVSRAFSALLQKVRDSPGSPFAPRDFRRDMGKVNPDFATNEQQDSQEFLTFLLDKLHEYLKHPRATPEELLVLLTYNDDLVEHPPPEAAAEAWRRFLAHDASVVAELCMGQERSENQCREPNCGGRSVRFAPFMMLLLPIPESGLTMPTLETCMADHLKPETLRGDQVWRCDECHRNTSSRKRPAITRAPRVLAVQLKRTVYTETGSRKVDALVNFPLRGWSVPVAPGMGEAAGVGSVYDLIAVSNHYGGGVHEGHCAPFLCSWCAFIQD